MGLVFVLPMLAYRYLSNKKPPAIFHVYQQPNGLYFFKVLFMFLVISFRQIVNKIKLSYKSKKKLDEYYAELEKPQNLSGHEKPIDAVYFNASNKNLDFLTFGMARRKDKLIDGFLYLKINDNQLGVLKSPKLPDTALYKTENNDTFEAEGIKVECLEPMKKWRVSYEGKMKLENNRDQSVDVKLNAIYSSTLPFFNFDTDMDALTMAKCLAHENWSREYFNTLKQNHQTHYEQHGDLSGTAEIDGKIYKLDMNCARDHSFGHFRDWTQMHKYNFNFFTTEDGDRFTVGFFCIPAMMSSFTMGYVYRGDKVFPIDRSDFKLYQHGENGTPPKDYAFTVRAGGKTYTIQVNIVHSPHFYISKDWECKVFEGLSKFEVNGTAGWGVAEWQYRNIEGRDVKDISS